MTALSFWNCSINTIALFQLHFPLNHDRCCCAVTCNGQTGRISHNLHLCHAGCAVVLSPQSSCKGRVSVIVVSGGCHIIPGMIVPPSSNNRPISFSYQVPASMTIRQPLAQHFYETLVKPCLSGPSVVVVLEGMFLVDDSLPGKDDRRAKRSL